MPIWSKKHKMYSIFWWFVKDPFFRYIDSNGNYLFLLSNCVANSILGLWKESSFSGAITRQISWYNINNWTKEYISTISNSSKKLQAENIGDYGEKNGHIKPLLNGYAESEVP